jgi:hypothetical protein
MKFFIPGIPTQQAETTYRSLYDTAKEQLRTPITEKRIFSLRYIHDKRPVSVVVGESHPHHPRYLILAILESQPHIVMTQSKDGKHGPTIMVANTEITDVVEFD